MSVTFKLMLEDDKYVLRDDVACFGSLQDTEEMLEWEFDGEYKPAILGVKYFLEEVDKEFFDYLMTLPLVQAAVLEYKLEDIEDNNTQYKGYVYVSAEVNGHHMLNVLSMFRTPVTFYNVINTWKNLVNEGIDERAAHVLSFRYAMRGGSLYKYSTNSGEHSYFSYSDIVSDLRREVAYLGNAAPAGPTEALSAPFSQVGRYVRSDDYDYWEDEYVDGCDCGVASQCVGYRSSPATGPHLPALVKEAEYVDVDVEKEKAAREKYASAPVTPETAILLVKELKAAVVRRGSEERPLSNEEAYAILSSLAQELLP